jgi:ribonuclease HII
MEGTTNEPPGRPEAQGFGFHGATLSNPAQKERQAQQEDFERGELLTRLTIERGGRLCFFSEPLGSREKILRMGARQISRLLFERELWQRGTTLVAGVDEAGCGPLAGPVTAAAVILPHEWLETGLHAKLRGLNDSKQLTEEEREKYFAFLTADSGIRFGVAVVDHEMIDRINIFQAARRAMNQALEQLRPAPQHVLVDGKSTACLDYPITALVKGDGRSYSIAAASVIAKVTRDRLMQEFDARYLGYGFAEHKGYATPRHLAALAALGPCPIHRRSFSPIRPVARELDLFETGPRP